MTNSSPSVTKLSSEDTSGLHSSNHNGLGRLIRRYYLARGLAWPSTHEAMLFAMSELGEAADVLVSINPSWTRNHPENKGYSPERLAEELGDVVMMVVVAGIQAGVDVETALKEKLGKYVG